MRFYCVVLYTVCGRYKSVSVCKSLISRLQTTTMGLPVRWHGIAFMHCNWPAPCVERLADESANESFTAALSSRRWSSRLSSKSVCIVLCALIASYRVGPTAPFSRHTRARPHYDHTRNCRQEPHEPWRHVLGGTECWRHGRSWWRHVLRLTIERPAIASSTADGHRRVY